MGIPKWSRLGIIGEWIFGFLSCLEGTHRLKWVDLITHRIYLGFGRVCVLTLNLWVPNGSESLDIPEPNSAALVKAWVAWTLGSGRFVEVKSRRLRLSVSRLTAAPQSGTGRDRARYLFDPGRIVFLLQHLSERSDRSVNTSARKQFSRASNCSGPSASI